MKGIVRALILLILVWFMLVVAGIVMSGGDADFGGLVMIGPIPIVFGTSPGITLAVMFIGLLLMLVYFMSQGKRVEQDSGYALYDREGGSQERDTSVKGGGVILIGPIPIVFGSDKRFVLIAMVLAIVLMLLAIIFIK